VPGLNDRGAAWPNRVKDEGFIQATAERRTAEEDDGAEQNQGGSRHLVIITVRRNDRKE
jgi:hypothetical protein